MSALHGNLPALDAVLADLAQFPVDQVVVAGDVVNWGPFSAQVLAEERFKVLLAAHATPPWLRLAAWCLGTARLSAQYRSKAPRPPLAIRLSRALPNITSTRPPCAYTFSVARSKMSST